MALFGAVRFLFIRHTKEQQNTLHNFADATLKQVLPNIGTYSTIFPNFFTDKTSHPTDFFKYIASFCLAHL